MTSPVYLAVDTPDLAKAQELARKVRNHVGGLKLGLEFFCANGHHGVHEMMKLGLPIFLDLKLHDIPNTVAKAVQALHVLEPAVLMLPTAPPPRPPTAPPRPPPRRRRRRRPACPPSRC